MTESQHRSPSPGNAWWLVLCLIGLDYFSTLAYLPSLAVEAVGPLAPLAAVVVVIVTLLIALPTYCYVVGRSPHGRGATGLIEQLVPGWPGKLLVLSLLAFVATDYVVTQNLSIADAAEHIRGNPLFREHVDPFLDRDWHPEQWSSHPWWQRIIQILDRQLVVTLLLTTATLALWAFWQSGSPRVFLRVATVVVIAYLVMNLIVLTSAVSFLAGPGQSLFHHWWSNAQIDLREEVGMAGPLAIGKLLRLALVSFPYVALGLSGFELSMAVTPLVSGDARDSPDHPHGRIRNMRKLLVAAACVMAPALLAGVSVTAMLVPPAALGNGGPAMHRALAYLAHGGRLMDGSSGTSLGGWFGPVFGTLYDLSTVCILCLAGACVAIALRDYVPESLKRFGMELDWAHRLGGKMRFFNLIILAVAVLFRAHISALQWAYATSMLVLLCGASLAALVALRQCDNRWYWKWLTVYPATFNLSFFLFMALLTLVISRAGLEIAAAFGVGIFGTSLLSRWIRSTELRFSGFEFVDDESRERWERCCAHEFQILVPHRPGIHSRVEKDRAIRDLHRIHANVPIILIEAELGDTSNFMQRPLVQVTKEDGFELIQVSRCVSVAHVLASIALSMCAVGHPPELHFGWSNESPLAANLNFLLFGEGNIPWMVRELLRKAEPDPERRPGVIVG